MQIRDISPELKPFPASPTLKLRRELSSVFYLDILRSFFSASPVPLILFCSSASPFFPF